MFQKGSVTTKISSIGTTSTSATALTVPPHFNSAKVLVNSANPIHLIFGTSSVAEASTADEFFAPGIPEIVPIPPSVTHVRAIATSGTGGEVLICVGTESQVS